MKKLLSVLILFTFFITACGQLQQSHYEGAGIGAAVGGVAGALLDKKNSWRGGVIGATLGAVFGATLADISQRGLKEAY
ncbi:glycine zipper 2TM domain-containing protein [Thermodesulfovibrio sp. 3907-1M]|uniref:Glycine zipper 2TM domain-containing protein n=1 Tax=Thermodesulfovibrio autotrophicus TaxID=3118333 RepID=A0AAU8GYZ9_9BACT